MATAVGGGFNTPVNKITRDDLPLLIRNNTINESSDFENDCDGMETDSPVRTPLRTLQCVNKKLFHTPQGNSNINFATSPNFSGLMERDRKSRKRKQAILPNSNERIKKVIVREREQDGYSPKQGEGMRRRVLKSLFYNKDYSMECSESEFDVSM